MNPINLTIVKVSPHEIIVETTNIILTKKLCSLQTGVNFWHSLSETLGFSCLKNEKNYRLQAKDGSEVDHIRIPSLQLCK